MRSEEPPPGTTADEGITREELRLAARNHGMPLEMLREDVTPVGLHYLLVHYDIPAIDADAWRLRIDGAVEQPLELSLSEVQDLPSATREVTLECAGTGRARLHPRALSQPWLHEAVSTGAWTGTPLGPLLERAGLSDRAVEVVFTGADRGIEGGVEQAYRRSLPRDEAGREEVMLAWDLNGAPLPPQHGFPLRLVVPGWYGMAHVKWLTSVTAVTEPFRGYQQSRAYRLRTDRDEEGQPLDRIAVRSLIAPPGIPDFYTRARTVDPGPVEVHGRAWSGRGPVTSVDFSDDGGATWTAASLGEANGPHAWHPWSVTWDPPGPGDYELCCRATDASGATQPLEPGWNLGGYAVNAVHRVAVTVRRAP